MIPLTYVIVRAQVGQLIEGTNGVTGLNPVLKTIALSSSGAYPITFAASKD